MNITDIQVKRIARENKVKAVASITFDGVFVVHDIKLVEGENGLFLAMPSRICRDGTFRDIAHPITSEAREYIQKLIIDKYNEETTIL